LAAATALVLAAQPDAEDDSTGHRGGAEGFKGEHCENTVEAVTALLQREQEQGPLPCFPYLEFDVQETADGELVVYHDNLLTRGIPAGGINAAPIAQLEQDTGTPFGLLTVADCRLVQLQALRLGGRPGVCIPTLKQFLEACIAGGVQRSLAIEVKQLLTDAGRLKFLDTISWYLEIQGPRLSRAPAIQGFHHREVIHRRRVGAFHRIRALPAFRPRFRMGPVLMA
jgi:glycerophosphoryl diester phosphodiesterase